MLCFPQQFVLAGMASLLKSQAAFKERALECGLTDAEYAALVSRGVTTLSGAAYAVSTPGVNPTEQALRGLLNPSSPDDVSVGSLAAIRRLVFESQTLAIAEVRLAIEGTDGAKRSELAPAERTSRVAAQKTRLCGYDLTGTMEVAHSCYTYVGTMIDTDSPFYLEPHRFITRAQEIAHERPGKEIILDASKLTVRDKATHHKMQIQNELQLSQALARRSLACDLMGVITFRTQENWHKFLLDRLAESPPPGFRRITMEQVLRADRQAWQSRGHLPVPCPLMQLSPLCLLRARFPSTSCPRSFRTPKISPASLGKAMARARTARRIPKGKRRLCRSSPKLSETCLCEPPAKGSACAGRTTLKTEGASMRNQAKLADLAYTCA